MILFLIKRSFWSWWENMLPLVIINMFFIFHVILIIAALNFLSQIFLLMFIVVAIIVVSLLFYISAASKNIFGLLKESKRISFKSFIQNYKTNVKEKIPVLVFSLIYFLIIGITIRNYSKMIPQMVPTIIFFLICWIAFFSAVGLGYFSGLQHHMKDKLFVTLKKCFILLFAHPGLSFVLAFFTIFQLSLSVPLLLFLPGISSVIVLWEEATRLLMLKYDYLEENPDTNFRKIPWDVILMDEKERLGHKSLKDLFNL